MSRAIALLVFLGACANAQGEVPHALKDSRHVRAARALHAAPDCKNAPILNPVCCNDTAPTAFNVTFKTTKGAVTIAVKRSQGPIGADRFWNLARNHYFDSSEVSGNDDGFFRVVAGTLVQFGIAGNPAVSGPWYNAVIPNDPLTLSNVRGTFAFAPEQDNSGQACNRTTQVFINSADNIYLDPLGYTPFGTISDADMKVVDSIYAGYAQDPDQDFIYSEGDVYLKQQFPLLDYIIDTTTTAVTW